MYIDLNGEVVCQTSFMCSVIHTNEDKIMKKKTPSLTHSSLRGLIFIYAVVVVVSWHKAQREIKKKNYKSKVDLKKFNDIIIYNIIFKGRKNYILTN